MYFSKSQSFHYQISAHCENNNYEKYHIVSPIDRLCIRCQMLKLYWKTIVLHLSIDGAENDRNYASAIILGQFYGRILRERSCCLFSSCLFRMLQCKITPRQAGAQLGEGFVLSPTSSPSLIINHNRCFDRRQLAVVPYDNYIMTSQIRNSWHPFMTSQSFILDEPL